MRGRLQVSGSYIRACELAEKRGDTSQLAMAVYGLWLSVVGSGRIFASRKLSSRLLGLVVGTEDDGLRLQAHHSAWTTCLFGGEPAAAREHL